MRSLISSSMDPGIPMFRANFIFPASSKNIFIRNMASTTWIIHSIAVLRENNLDGIGRRMVQARAGEVGATLVGSLPDDGEGLALPSRSPVIAHDGHARSRVHDEYGPNPPILPGVRQPPRPQKGPGPTLGATLRRLHRSHEFELLHKGPAGHDPHGPTDTALVPELSEVTLNEGVAPTPSARVRRRIAGETTPLLIHPLFRHDGPVHGPGIHGSHMDTQLIFENRDLGGVRRRRRGAPGTLRPGCTRANPPPGPEPE